MHTFNIAVPAAWRSMRVALGLCLSAVVNVSAAVDPAPVTYEVWGGNFLDTNFNPPIYTHVDKLPGWVKLGSTNATATFVGRYNYYIIAVKSVLLLDAVQASTGSYFNGPGPAWGNVLPETADRVFGPPDGQYMLLQGNLISRGETYGAFAVFYNPGTWTSLRFFVPTAPPIHDLAVVSIKPAKTVTLTETQPTLTKPVRVTIQNRSNHDETIPDVATLRELVRLEVRSVGQQCSAPVAVFVDGPPQRPLPVTLKPKQKFNVMFNVTYACANDEAKNIEGDFRYIATVRREVLDGIPDIDPADDACPHDAPFGGMDPYTPAIRDMGAGSKQPDGLLGGEVLTDIVVR